MKIKNKFIIATLSLLLSFNASAHLLLYNLDLDTSNVEGPAFGGVAVGDSFHGLLAIEAEFLQNIVDNNGGFNDDGFSNVIIPLQDENDNFNLSYSINVGNYIYTEQTAGSFDSEFSVINPEDVVSVAGLSLDISDLSFNDLEISALTQPDPGPDVVVADPSFPLFVGSWSATDSDSGNVVSGVISVSDVPSAVPIPAAVWLFGSGLLGLSGLKRETTKLI